MLTDLIRVLQSTESIYNVARNLCREGEGFDTAIPVDIQKELQDTYNVDTQFFVMFYDDENKFGKLVNVIQFVNQRIAEYMNKGIDYQIEQIGEMVDTYEHYQKAWDSLQVELQADRDISLSKSE